MFGRSIGYGFLKIVVILNSIFGKFFVGWQTKDDTISICNIISNWTLEMVWNGWDHVVRGSISRPTHRSQWLSVVRTLNCTRSPHIYKYICDHWTLIMKQTVDKTCTCDPCSAYRGTSWWGSTCWRAAVVSTNYFHAFRSGFLFDGTAKNNRMIWKCWNRRAKRISCNMQGDTGIWVVKLCYYNLQQCIIILWGEFDRLLLKLL